MKKFISLIALCIATVTAHAGIQIASVYNGGTNNIGAGAIVLTNNLPSAANNTNFQAAASFYAGTSQDIYFQVSGGYANAGAGTGSVTVQLMQSADNVIWTNSAAVVLTLLASTTNTALNAVTNINDAAPFYCVANITAATNGAGAGPLTNILVKAFTKTGI